MRIGLAQYEATPDVPTNLDRALGAAQEAAARGVELLVFPEGYMARVNGTELRAVDVAQPLDGAFVSALCRAALTYGMVIVCGVAERIPDEKVRAFNSTVTIGSDGSLLAVYRKTHLFDALGRQESLRNARGDQPPPVVPTPLGKLGIMVCYEIRFPELARSLTLRGADLLVVPAAWVGGPLKEEQWLTLARARAIENTIFLASAGQAGLPYVGRSLLVDPMGTVLVDGGEEEGVWVADIDLGRVKRVREKLPSLQHRRPELYLDFTEVG